ncbi:MAG TPA: hypothetical protein VFT74_22285 [Isosphaeraceae bacterium]|nr:hypothetical protein [Isosphaeraceae bacterium]
MNVLKSWLRRQPLWVRVQELNREGWSQVLKRRRYQRQILGTGPIRTLPVGESPVEIRTVTYRRDWINAIWAIKSFLHQAGVQYPVVFHDGGLLPGQDRELLRHFPDAQVISRADGDARMLALLEERGKPHCAEMRRTHVMARKLFDLHLLSTAETVITIDSDVLFFRRPTDLIRPEGGWPVNLYNGDAGHWYTMELDDLEAKVGVRPPVFLNAGLAVVRRESIDLDRIEQWLSVPEMWQGDPWLLEQTLHALCSTVHGIALLPSTYLVSTEPGLPADLISKHYPGFFRPLLYQEGMARLIESGFLDRLREQPLGVASAVSA